MAHAYGNADAGKHNVREEGSSTNRLTSDDPGGPWPNMAISHSYAHSGAYPVSVSSTWEAWFTVDGLGPWPVGGPPVVQVASPPPVLVVEARAELVVG